MGPGTAEVRNPLAPRSCSAVFISAPGLVVWCRICRVLIDGSGFLISLSLSLPSVAKYVNASTSTSLARGRHCSSSSGPLLARNRHSFRFRCGVETLLVSLGRGFRSATTNQTWQSLFPAFVPSPAAASTFRPVLLSQLTSALDRLIFWTGHSFLANANANATLASTKVLSLQSLLLQHIQSLKDCRPAGGPPPISSPFGCPHRHLPLAALTSSHMRQAHIRIRRAVLSHRRPVDHPPRPTALVRNRR